MADSNDPSKPCPTCGHPMVWTRGDGYWCDTCPVTSVEPGCTCGGVAACPQCQDRDRATLIGPDGFTRLVPRRAIAEAQWNALEMARKADQAERRAEDAESAYERLRAAADKVGHQAVCPVEPCECWMRDLAPLLNGAGERWELVAECEQGAGDDTWSVAVFREQEGCAHEWLDRPESDTRECLVCGTEVAG